MKKTVDKINNLNEITFFNIFIIWTRISLQYKWQKKKKKVARLKYEKYRFPFGAPA